MMLHPDFLKMPIAHRGLHNQNKGILENSLPSFRNAVDYGYGIELDVQFSNDCKSIVFHDHLLDRMTCEVGAVGSYCGEELEKIKLKGSLETIPSLSHVLSSVNGRVPVLVEIKREIGQEVSFLEDSIEALKLLLLPYEGPLAIMSFDSTVLEFCSLAMPRIPRGLTSSCDTDLLDSEDIRKIGCSFIAHNYKKLKNSRLNILRQQGLFLLSWTIESAAVEKTVGETVDNIIFEKYFPELRN